MGAGRSGRVKDLHRCAAICQFCGNRQTSNAGAYDRPGRHADHCAWK